eukprot:g1288.t1
MADEQPPARRGSGRGGRKADKGKRKQGKKEEKPGRGAKKRRGEEHEEEEEESKQQQADDDEDEQRYNEEDEYDPRFDGDPIDVHVAKGDGETYDHTFALEATVGDVKQELERKWGLSRDQQRLYLDHEEREEDLRDDGEGLRGMRSGKREKVRMSVLMEVADAQEVVPKRTARGAQVLGDGDAGYGDDQFDEPRGAVWVPSHQEWLVTTETYSYRVKVINARTGAMICKFGNGGNGEGQFSGPWGVAITSDSSLVMVADQDNNRVQVLRLVVGADGQSARLEFVRSIIGNGEGEGEGQLHYPSDVAVLEDAGGQQTVLIIDMNHRVSQFALDTGAFIRTFAGSKTGKSGSGDGLFDTPMGIAVLGSEGEVAVADGYNNNRVQIFDREGNYLRQFGTYGTEDGQFACPTSLASDAHGNILVTDYLTSRLQVFNSKGRHMCTNSDLGLRGDSDKGVAWGKGGQLAVANGNAHEVRAWLGS